VNVNTQGNNAKLQATFNHEQFPELDKPAVSNDSIDNSNKGRNDEKTRTSRKRSKRSMASKQQKLDKKRGHKETSQTGTSAMDAQATSPARSYSSIA
jgi:hypothetical protein